MAALQKFNVFTLECWQAKHDFSGAHTYRLVLGTAAPSVGAANIGAVTGLLPGNSTGYPAGGGVLSVHLTTAGGVAKVAIDDYTFTSTAVGGIGPFRYGIIVNAHGSPGDLVAFFDHGASVTLDVGETFKVDFDAGAGAFTLA
jgi:hypothetical protein